MQKSNAKIPRTRKTERYRKLTRSPPKISNFDKRKHPLDDAFMFVVGLTTVVFAILQTVLRGGAVLLFTPLLISGLIYPFYIGYIRGAILYDDFKRERARGWVCLSVGVSFYFYAFLVISARDFVPQLYGYDVWLAVMIITIGGWVTRRVVRWYSSIVGLHPTESDLLFLGASVGAASLLALVTWFLEEYIRFWIEPPRALQTPLSAGLIVIVWLFPIFVIIERVIDNLTARNLKLGEISERDDSAPRFARSLYYVLNGAMECGLIGFLSDRIAAIAYTLSVLLVFGFTNPGIVGTVTGGSAIVLMIFVIWRFLRCPIKPEALTKMEKKSSKFNGS